MALGDELRKILMAGVGAVAVTAEKTKEIVDGLIEKGELTVEQGKVVSDEFCKNVSERVERAAKKVDMSALMMKLSPEELEHLKELITRMQEEKAREEEAAEQEPEEAEQTAGNGAEAPQPEAGDAQADCAGESEPEGEDLPEENRD